MIMEQSNNNTFLKQHLKERHLDIGLYSGIQLSDDIVFFPLWNLSGQMVGYQQYRPLGEKKVYHNLEVGKYFTHTTKVGNNSSLGVWGLETLCHNDDTVYLVEGIFKACRFHNFGLNAIAVLGNNPKHLTEWLRTLDYCVYAICDGDEAGAALAKHGDKSFQLRDGDFLDEFSKWEFVQFLGALRMGK